MTKNNSSLPIDIAKIWNNWKVRNEKGNCKNCPAHWSKRDDISDNEAMSARPWYGSGTFRNPDLAFVGKEPGTIKSNNITTDETPDSFNDVRYEKLSDRNFAYSLTVFNRIVKKLEGDGFELYWTNIRKCNELGDEGDKKARKNCSNYLEDEFNAIEPDYLVALGKNSLRYLSDLYHGIEFDKWSSNFSEKLDQKSEDKSFHLESLDAKFDLIIIPHPGPGFSHYSKRSDYLGNVEPGRKREEWADKFVREISDQI